MIAIALCHAGDHGNGWRSAGAYPGNHSTRAALPDTEAHLADYFPSVSFLAEGQPPGPTQKYPTA